MNANLVATAVLPWLLAGGIAAPLQAQEPEPEAAEKQEPAKKPDVKALVEQLGDPSYRQRRDAEEALEELGEPALEALREAAKGHSDSEVQWRARRLVGRIEGGGSTGLRERRQDPGTRRDVGRLPGGGVPELSDVFDDVFRQLERDFDVDVPRHHFFEDEFFQDLEAQMQALRERMRDLHGRGFDDFGAGTGQALEMRVGPDGVSVKVSEQNEQGETETKTYEAPDLEAFREKYPEVAKRYLDGGGARRFAFRFDPDRAFGGPGALRAMPFGGLQPRALDLQEDGGPRLGILVKELDAGALQELGIEAESGLQVESVVPGSLAERLGIEPADVVLEIDGTAVGSPEEVREALEGKAEQVKVKIHRGDGERVLEGDKDAAGSKPKELEPRKLRRRG